MEIIAWAFRGPLTRTSVRWLDAGAKLDGQKYARSLLTAKGGIPKKATADPSAQKSGLVMTMRRLLQGWRGLVGGAGRSGGEGRSAGALRSMERKSLRAAEST